jgi:hypothetical protein
MALSSLTSRFTRRARRSTIPACPRCSRPLERSHVHDGVRYTPSAEGSVLTTRTMSGRTERK